MRATRIALAVCLFTTAANAADWTSYSNLRFGTAIDTPPGFVNDVPEPSNGDGLTFHSIDGKAELLVWGNNLVDEDFRADGQLRLKGETDDGWSISFQKGFGNEKHVFSGSKGERTMYLRSLASCKGTQALHFRIEYPEAQKRDYDPVVERIGISLKAGPASDCP